VGAVGWSVHPTPGHLAGGLPNYDVLPDGSVVCRLRCRIGREWLTKMDMGGPSVQPDGGDRLKAAFGDGAPCSSAASKWEALGRQPCGVGVE
jgi:hypothetical protein